MKQASVRDLRYDFAKVEALLRDGEEIEITKRRRVIARLAPVRPAARPAYPDFEERRRRMFGDQMITPSVAEVLAEDRARY